MLEMMNVRNVEDLLKTNYLIGGHLPLVDFVFLITSLIVIILAVDGRGAIPLENPIVMDTFMQPLQSYRSFSLTPYSR